MNQGRACKRMLLVIGASLVLSVAQAAHAQSGDLPSTIVQSGSQLSEDQTTQIRAFVDAHAERLKGTPDQISAARRTLLQPLDPSNKPSVSFRIRYSQALSEKLSKLLSSDSEMAEVNALVLAGELATEDSLPLFKSGHASSMPSVRYQAAFASKRLLTQVESNQQLAALVGQSRLVDIVKTLSGELAKENDPIVLDALLDALTTACTVQTVRNNALESLAGSLHDLVKRQGSTAFQSDLLDGLVRSGVSIRDLLISRPTGVQPQTLKKCAQLGGAMVWHAKQVIENKSLPTGDTSTRERLASLAGSGEAVVLLAGQQLNAASSLRSRNMADAVKAANAQGDAKFVNDAQSLLGAGGDLFKPPFELSAGLFK